MSVNAVPLVYVFIGYTLPDYVTPSLRLTRRFFRGDMVLLTNAQNTPTVKGVVVEDFSAWYQPEPFSRFAEKTPLDSTFRGGFWLVTAERFFVLSQYMTEKNVSKLFHAELDNLVFNLDGVSDSLDRLGSGIFYPTDTGGAGLGSLVYCNDESSLSQLTAFMANNSHLGDEMTILGQFVREKPSVARALPSATALGNGGPKGLTGGLFDAATMGQWLFGIDPANTVYTTYNHANNPYSPDDLGGVKFSLKAKKGLLVGKTKSFGQFPIHNVHVHAKIFSRLVRPGVLKAYLILNRFPRALPVVIRPGHWRHRVLKLLLNHSHRVPLRRLLTSAGGQRVLRFLVASSRVPLSNRQLESFHGLLPQAASKSQSSESTKILFHVGSSGGEHLISCVVSRGDEAISFETAERPMQPDASNSFTSPREVLEFLLSLDLDTVTIVEGEASEAHGTVVAPAGRQVLWPDMAKPQWEPHFELPIFPYRSRAVTFTTTPQVVSLNRLREIFSSDNVAHRWAKQVRPDTFVPALMNAYGQHVLVSGRKTLLVARSS